MPVQANRSRKPRRRYGPAARLACLALVLALVVAAHGAPRATASPAVHISGQSEQILQTLLTVRNDASSAGPSERSELLSRQFLGTPYGANTLIGSASEPEQLVVELQKVDCFTFAAAVPPSQPDGVADVQVLPSRMNTVGVVDSGTHQPLEPVVTVETRTRHLRPRAPTLDV